MFNQLSLWFSEYSPKNADKAALKNPLIIFSRGHGLGRGLPSMKIDLARKTIDDVLSIHISLPNSVFSRPLQTASPDDTYPPATVDTFTKLQRRWRARISHLQHVQSQKKTPGGRWTLMMLKITAACANSILRVQLRKFCIPSDYPALFTKLADAQNKYSATHDRVMLAFDRAIEPSECKKLDLVLARSVQVEDSLAVVAESLSEDGLERLISEGGQVQDLRTRHNTATLAIQQATHELEQIEDVLKQIG
ncbi:MAG: hypothetical protein Q9220_003102 [cf. Caloplaca sp. 1 TL-2023]